MVACQLLTDLSVPDRRRTEAEVPRLGVQKLGRNADHLSGGDRNLG